MRQKMHHYSSIQSNFVPTAHQQQKSNKNNKFPSKHGTIVKNYDRYLNKFSTELGQNREIGINCRKCSKISRKIIKNE